MFQSLSTSFICLGYHLHFPGIGTPSILGFDAHTHTHISAPHTCTHTFLHAKALEGEEEDGVVPQKVGGVSIVIAVVL